MAATRPSDVELLDGIASGGDPFDWDVVGPRSATSQRKERRRAWIIRRALLVADLAGLAVAFAVAQLVFGRHDAPVDRLSAVGEAGMFVLTLPLWVAAAKLYGLYDRDQERADHSTADDVSPIFHLVTMVTFLFVLGTWVTGLADPSPTKLIAFWAIAIVVVPLSRGCARGLCRRSSLYVQKTVIVGSGKVAQLVAHKLLRHPEFGVDLLGFVDERWERSEDIDRPELLGSIEHLPAIVESHRVERVVIAFPTVSDDRALDTIRLLRHLTVQVDVVPRFFEILSPNVDVHAVEGVPLIGLRPFRLSRSAQLAKRVTDVLASSVALVLLAPLFLAVAVVLKLEGSGAPVFFRQVRMGMGDRTFLIFKFRTMVNGAEEMKQSLEHLNVHGAASQDSRMFKIPDDPRVTRIGRFLRRTSIDELPQLINVFRGEMSIVGPRPLVLEEDQHVRRWARRRLTFLPGITGPWQALGRSDIPFDEMVCLDYLYVTEWSLVNDFKWVVRTVPALFRRRNAY